MPEDTKTKSTAKLSAETASAVTVLAKPPTVPTSTQASEFTHFNLAADLKQRTAWRLASRSTALAQLSSQDLAIVLEETARSVMEQLVFDHSGFRDPISGLPLPLPPLPLKFEQRGRDANGHRMTAEEFISDDAIGYGAYKRAGLLFLPWINNVDEPLYDALIYQVHKAQALAKKAGHEFNHDRFCLGMGCITAGTLLAPPPELEMQAKILIFVKKMTDKLIVGKRGARENP